MSKLLHSAKFYSILAFIVLWQVLAIIVNYPDLFPSVTDLLITITKMLSTSTFYVSLGYTLMRGLFGFAIAGIMAMILSISALKCNFLQSFLHPWIVIMRSIPVISLVLIALLWLSPPGLPVFIAFFTMFPMLYQSFLTALEETDAKLVAMAHVYRKTYWQKLKFIYMPSASNIALSGMATAMGFGWRAVIIGEVLAGPLHGIGTDMKKAQSFIDMRELLAWTLVAIGVSFIFDFILKKRADKALKFKLKNRCKHHLKAKNQTDLNIDLKIVKLINLKKKFKDKILFEKLNLTVDNQQIYLLQSASGSGKTTLFNILSGITKADEGSIKFTPVNPNIAYAFQDIRLIPWMTVKQNIAFSLPHFPCINATEQLRLYELMSMMEINVHANKLPDELSGGEQQRVNLARALIVQADILLLDEALNGLEAALKTKLIHFIEVWNSKHKPLILWATHIDMQFSHHESKQLQIANQT